MKLVTHIFAYFACVYSLLGTAQETEILIYKGEEKWLSSTPLWGYFPGEEESDEKRLAFMVANEMKNTRSSCWRGYHGTWKISDDKLWLVKVEPQFRQSEQTRTIKTKDGREINTYYGEFLPKQEELPLFADWYTGTLKIQMGELLKSVNQGFASIYEKDLFIEVENGKVISEKIRRNSDSYKTRSSADLAWVELGNKLVEDDEEWIDARTITPTMLKESIRTRGILYVDNQNQEHTMFIPESQLTEHLVFRLKLESEFEDLPVPGSHIELTGAIEEDKESLLISVKKIRALLPGETIHHPKYKIPNQTQVATP
ncbi:hypothetical protein DDZ13_08215 [Coraliomargarita sinensis]|uniref:Uncharacterized protein n=1 Tax=Coraliomargarita sinensis TaxID=2174842 RepID=A0A317ZFC1_9BACT|nr:hypothetical protein [Coraliomargarita sinensis]PXA04020.1 hypothetical protein DDZ13_08215 [Coraliomargarita sinensis]